MLVKSACIRKILERMNGWQGDNSIFLKQHKNLCYDRLEFTNIQHTDSYIGIAGGNQTPSWRIDENYKHNYSSSGYLDQ